MKIRTGFVTNSSSSSFTIYIKNVDTIVAGIQNPTVNALWNFFLNCFKDGEPIKTASDLVDYLMDREGYKEVDSFIEDMRDDQYMREDFEKMLSYIDGGYIILKKSVEYGADEGVSEMLEAIEDGENIIVESNN
jgi:hypothetical protein